MYERAMEEFAVDQLFKERDRRCHGGPVPKLIYPNDRYADGACPAGDFEIPPGGMQEPAMKYVVVRHEEQMTEDAYVLNEGTAYVPLFSERIRFYSG